LVRRFTIALSYAQPLAKGMAWPLKHLVMLVRARATQSAIAFALRANVEFRFIKFANDAPCPQKAELGPFLCFCVYRGRI